MPGSQSSSGGPALFADVLAKGRFQTPHHSQERDPHQDLVGYSGPLYEIRGSLADHLLCFSLIDEIDKLFVERGVYGPHLWPADVAGETPASQHRDFPVIVVTDEFT